MQLRIGPPIKFLKPAELFICFMPYKFQVGDMLYWLIFSPNWRKSHIKIWRIKKPI